MAERSTVLDMAAIRSKLLVAQGMLDAGADERDIAKANAYVAEALAMLTPPLDPDAQHASVDPVAVGDAVRAAHAALEARRAEGSQRGPGRAGGRFSVRFRRAIRSRSWGLARLLAQLRPVTLPPSSVLPRRHDWIALVAYRLGDEDAAKFYAGPPGPVRQVTGSPPPVDPSRVTLTADMVVQEHSTVGCYRCEQPWTQCRHQPCPGEPHGYLPDGEPHWRGRRA